MAQRSKSANATLSDVAKQAGVSIATASRVLSNADYPVSQKLKKRIIKASNDLGYFPGLSGKMRKNNASHIVGIIVPTLQNPFFNKVTLGVEAAASPKGYDIMVSSSHRSVAQERKNIRAMLQNRVMLLVICSIDSSPDALKEYMNCGGRVALLESDFDLPGAIKVGTDYRAAGHLVVNYLERNGHKRIAFLTSPLSKTYRRQIMGSVKEAMEKHSIAFSDDDIYVAESEKELDTGLYEFELGKQLVSDLLKRRKKYTAIIAINDITAFGIINALSQNGISVPEEISVISFDNIPFSEMTYPPLTTVEMQSSAINTAIMSLLLDLENRAGETSPDILINSPCMLEERQSVRNLTEESAQPSAKRRKK